MLDAILRQDSLYQIGSTDRDKLTILQEELNTLEREIYSIDLNELQHRIKEVSEGTEGFQPEDVHQELSRVMMKFEDLDMRLENVEYGLEQLIEQSGIVIISQVEEKETSVQEPLLEASKRRYSLLQLSTLGERGAKWERGLSYLSDRPLFGFGFGTEGMLFAYHNWPAVEWMYTGAYMHNSYLGLMLQVGILGAVLQLLPMAFLIVGEVRQFGRSSRSVVRVAILGVVLTGMTSAFLSSWIYSMGNPHSLLLWSCVMLLVRFRVQVDVATNGVRPVAKSTGM
jgi:uncharacterized membrane protein YbaN (DUF454 family)